MKTKTDYFLAFVCVGGRAGGRVSTQLQGCLLLEVTDVEHLQYLP